MIKTISLDDIATPQPGENTQAKSKALLYNPNYAANNPAQHDGTKSHGMAPLRSFGEPNSESSRAFGTSMTRFNTLMGGKFSDNAATRKAFIIAVTLVLLAVAVFFYLDSEGMFEDVHIQSIEEAVSSTDITPAGLKAKKEKGKNTDRSEALTTQRTPSVGSQASAMTSNPYWGLPTPLEIGAGEGEAAAPSVLENWRYGLTHPYTYQRFKTVKSMRARRGAREALLDGLSQGKFWTRMEAFLGLAEMGEGVSPETAQTIFASVRADLPRNYFRRFARKTDAASTYVMQMSLRVVDARAREVIIHNLAKNRNASNDLYLYAATLDSSPHVSRFAQKEIAARALAAGTENAYRKAIAEASPQQSPDLFPAKTNEPKDLKVETIPNHTNVEEVYFLNEENGTEAMEAKPESPPVADDGFESLENPEDAP
jgi:hypothetical protein